ncbi:MAG: class I SAM-dependent methyltransferase [Chitinophagaceae bacterium]|nr:class I SAM-dependent methyltransferase [Chitinophagaceae bacterium]
MFEFHADKRRYFDIQKMNAEKYVIPFIEETFAITPGMRVLEIGCGEAGVLLPFLERQAVAVGVELDAPRLIMANEMLKDYVDRGKVRFIAKDIYDTDPEKELGGSFDLIILKDVIEHIHDQPRLIAEMKRFLNPGGCIFFGFPPWQMPFGGHQQMNSNRWMSKLPYYHLLPRPVYKWLLHQFKGPVDDLMEIRDTGISIERFEKIVEQTGYRVSNKTHYLVNPIYEYKFGWKVRKQATIIKALPHFRNYFTTCAYYLITPYLK